MPFGISSFPALRIRTMDFDIDMAKKQTNENPVYYAQYAHARMCSILRSGEDITLADHYELITHEKELDLLKHINEFASAVADARQNPPAAQNVQLYHPFGAAVPHVLCRLQSPGQNKSGTERSTSGVGEGF